VNFARLALSTLRRLSIAIAIAILFLFGLATTVYLSLRSPEVTVPDVIGKDRFEAEKVLGSASLNFRVRATRPSQVKADTVLFQLPRAGEIVKAGQTVAMDISRPVKDGESSTSPVSEPTPEVKAENRNINDNAAANENKPKRNKNSNKNENENSNANTGLRNANSNRPATNSNTNTGNSNRATNLNSNRPPSNVNTNPTRNSNDNGTPRPPAPKPSPVPKPMTENHKPTTEKH
jgi:beta-lactam-binding protein with PASTA domain